MSYVTSCGLLIKVNDKYLLVHATQPDSYIYKETDRFWSVPKGIKNKDESDIEAAIRETQEETNIKITDFYDINKAVQFPDIILKKKTIKIFLINEPNKEILNVSLSCPSLIINKNMPYMNGKPEVDMFKWVTKDEAKTIIFNSQINLFNDK